MKLPWVLLTVVVSVTLQLTLARYTVGGRWLFDLVLVGVVYAALWWGPAAGMVAGTVGGLIQDVLSDDVVGTGGLAKTIVGFLAGAIGTQFVVTRPTARLAILAGASIVHRLLMVALHAAIDQHWSGIPWTGMLGETLLNSACGLLVFQATESLPGAVAKGRNQRRSKLSRRNW